MLAHSRKGRTKTTEKALRRIVERINKPSSRRKEEIIIGSLRRALHLAVNMENGIKFASNVTQRVSYIQHTQAPR
jgi:LDH2 family malate/lactate/ureidoglycolate dehydrogenase